MPDRNARGVRILWILIVVWIGNQQTVFGDGLTKLDKNFIKRKFAAVLVDLNPTDRHPFMLECANLGQGSVCNTSVVGEHGKFHFKTDISQDRQNRFWAAYRCYMKQEITLCPVDGGWTQWNEWADCNAKCGDLSDVTRVRQCRFPSPTNNGNICQGHNKQHRICKGICGKNDTDESREEALRFINKIQGMHPELKSVCFKSHCAYETLKKFINKTDIKDKYWSSLQCYKYSRACPVDGNWSPWNEWSQCSPSCGNGIQYRIRECNNPPPNDGGYKCLGKMYEEKDCVGNDCKTNEFDVYSPILSDWSDFKPCSEKCGRYGTSKKIRKCLNNKACVDHKIFDVNVTHTKPCYNGPCYNIGSWSAWSENSRSSSWCGPGRFMRFRVCNQDQPTDGAVCKGKSVERIPTQEKCFQKDLEWFATKIREIKRKTKGSNDHPPEDETKVTPMKAYSDDLYTPWSSWTKCPKPCLTGIRERIRECKENSPKSNLVDNGDDESRAVTNYLRMKREGNRTKPVSHRPKPKNVKGKLGGVNCKGELWQNQPCNMINCAIKGGWSDWEPWTSCSVTCGKGERTRYRRCDQPLPKFGGTCFGENNETETCELGGCGKRVRYTSWSGWTSCNNTCGVGNKERQRNCRIPEGVNPSKVSHHCNKQFLEATTICNAFPCPINGAWGNWNSWSTCSSSCGLGHFYRDRTCTYPAPKYHGDRCFGIGTDVMRCYKMPCEVPKQHFLKLTDGKILYKKRGFQIGFFSVFVQFNSRKSNQILLKHTYDKCKTEVDCRHSVQIEVASNHLVATVKLKSQEKPIIMKSEDNSIQKDKWHNVYLHLAETRAFIRIDDYKKYEAEIEWDTKEKVNFDGYTKIGPFTGKIALLRINLIEFNLKNWPHQEHMYPTVVENGVYTDVKSDSEDAVVGYSMFNGHSFIKIPLHKNSADNLTVELTIMPTSSNGLLLFNAGVGGGSYVYLILKEGALVFCVSNSKTPKCETIINPTLYKWCKVEVIVSDQHAAVSVNRDNAIQITMPDVGYKPASSVLVGGGEKSDEFMYSMVVGTTEGFHGIIHEIIMNGKKYLVDGKPIINDQGELSSLGINSPGKSTEVYEHRDSAVEFRCDYTAYDDGVNTRIEWFKEDELLPVHQSIKVVQKIPGAGSVGELDLSPSPNQTGLYSCAVNVDGFYTVLHSYYLIRHDMKIVHLAEEEEEIGLIVFLIITPLILSGCVFFLATHRMKVIHTKALEEAKKSILADLEGSAKSDEKRVRIAVDESYDTDAVKESEMEGTVLDTDGTEGVQGSGTEGADTSFDVESSKAPTRETSGECLQMEDIPEAPEEAYNIQDIQEGLNNDSSGKTLSSVTNLIKSSSRQSEVELRNQTQRSSKDSMASHPIYTNQSTNQFISDNRSVQSIKQSSTTNAAYMPRSDSQMPQNPSQGAFPRSSSHAIHQLSTQTVQQPSSQTMPTHSSQMLQRPPSQTLSRAPSQPLSRAPSQPLSRAPSQPLSRAPSQPISRAPSQPLSRAPSQPLSHAPSQPLSHAPFQPLSRAPSLPHSPSQPLSRRSSKSLPRNSSQSLRRPSSQTLPQNMAHRLSSSTIPPTHGRSTALSIVNAPSDRNAAMFSEASLSEKRTPYDESNLSTTRRNEMSNASLRQSGATVVNAQRQGSLLDPPSQNASIGPPLYSSSRMSRPRSVINQQSEQYNSGSKTAQSTPKQHRSRSTIDSQSQDGSGGSNMLYVSRNEYQDEDISLDISREIEYKDLNRSGYSGGSSSAGHVGRQEIADNPSALYISRHEYEDDDHANVDYISKSRYKDQDDVQYVSRNRFSSNRSPTRVLPSELRSPSKRMNAGGLLFGEAGTPDLGIPPPPPPPNWMQVSKDSSFSAAPQRFDNQIALPPTGSPSPTKIADPRYSSPTRTLPSPEKNYFPREQSNDVVTDSKSIDSDDKISIVSISSPKPKSPSILDPAGEFRKSIEVLTERRISLHDDDADSSS